MGSQVNDSQLSISSFAAFEGLQTPIWVYDIQQLKLLWANRAALAIWDAETLEEWLTRDMSNVTEAPRTGLNSYQERLQQGKTIREVWTFFPKGNPISVRCLCSGIALPDGRAAMLVEGHPLQASQTEAKRQCMTLALQESDQLYETLVQSLSEGVVLHQADGQIMACNESAFKILGRCSQTIPGQTSIDPYWQSIYPDGTPFPRELHPAMVTLRTGRAQRDVVMGLPKADGSVTWISINTQPIWQSDDEHPHAVVTSFADITARKQVEDELRSVSHRLTNVLAASPAVIYTFDIKQPSRPTFISNNAAILTGYSATDLLQHLDWFADIVLDEDVSAILQPTEQWLESGAVSGINFIYRIRRADGQVIWVDDCLTTIRDANGQIVELVGAITDITELKVVEVALRESETAKQAMLDAIPDLLLRMNHQGICLNLMTGGEIQLWKPIEPGAQQSIYDLLPTAVADKRMYYVHRALETGKRQIYRQELMIDGRLVIEEVRIVPINDREVLAMVRNMTEWVMAEAALRQQAQRDRLMAQITQRISQFLDLPVISEVAVTEVRQLLNTERVFIYRFGEEQTNPILAESVAEGYLSLQSFSIFPNCYNPTSDTVAVDFTDVQTIPDINAANLATSCLATLRTLDVNAVLGVPIRQNDQVWGVLVAHSCSGPRLWQPSEVDMLSQLANQLAIAIQQSELYAQLKQANQELQHLATHDTLTGVANRRYFDDYLSHEWRRLARERAPLALILCDIDYFKPYNDTCGHIAGDHCLKEVADVIISIVQRPADLVARYGGEEFAIILPNTDLGGAEYTAQAIHKAVDTALIPHPASPVKPYITVSLGVACLHPTLGRIPAQLTELADAAMYKAKHQGRNRYCMAE
jgi:diguanylate cyclase (GGDEF)-like protein/PAS domain S-box-containing protein